LAAFGSVKADEVGRLIERELESLNKGEPALQTPAEPKPLTAAMEVVEHRPKQQAVLMTGFHGIDLANSDRAALELIDEACSDLGSRLFLRIREQMGLAYFVGSSQLVGLVRGAFTFYLDRKAAWRE